MDRQYIDFLKSLILHRYIKISDLPFVLRTTQKSFYIMAFRANRDIPTPDQIGYENVLLLLMQDIQRLKEQRGNWYAFARLYLAYFEDGERYFGELFKETWI